MIEFLLYSNLSCDSLNRIIEKVKKSDMSYIQKIEINRELRNSTPKCSKSIKRLK